METPTGPDDDFGRLLEEIRARMNTAVRLRLDARLRGRLSASDVVQEAYLEATRRFASFQPGPEKPLVLWVRFLVMQQLQLAHRRHLGVAARSASLEARQAPDASAENLLDAFVGSDSTPSRLAIRGERIDRLRSALNELDTLSRDILAMRHFECLSNREAAQALGIKESTASQRYARALLRLRDLLEPNPSEGAME
jgi:RNA polymerase sigma-70 factor (ECF subfamily)